MYAARTMRTSLTSPLFHTTPPPILQLTIRPQHSASTHQASTPHRVPSTSDRICCVDFVCYSAMTRVTVSPLTTTAVWASVLPTPAPRRPVDVNDDLKKTRIQISFASTSSQHRIDSRLNLTVPHSLSEFTPCHCSLPSAPRFDSYIVSSRQPKIAEITFISSLRQRRMRYCPRWTGPTSQGYDQTRRSPTREDYHSQQGYSSHICRFLFFPWARISVQKTATLPTAFPASTSVSQPAPNAGGFGTSSASSIISYGFILEFPRAPAGTDDGRAASYLVRLHLVPSLRPVDPSPCLSPLRRVFLLP